MAIVWGAMVGDALQIALMNWMNHLTKDEQARLTEINGPLATFASKITIAYGIRLVTKEQSRDLNIIKEVRNAFVHEVGGLSSSTKEIADVCAQLSLVARIQPKGPINPRACYRATCLQFWSGMGGYGVSLGIKIDTGEMSPLRYEIGDEERYDLPDGEQP